MLLIFKEQCRTAVIKFKGISESFSVEEIPFLNPKIS